MGLKEVISKKVPEKLRDYSNRNTTNNIQDNLNKEKEEPIPTALAISYTRAQYEEKLRNSNKLWKEVLEVLPIQDDGTLGIFKERIIFHSDAEYEVWIQNGEPDKRFREGRTYIVVRTWLKK